MAYTSTAISAQGSKIEISTGSGTPVSVTAVAVGFPTILTCTGISNGDVVTLANFGGADAALLNGLSFVAQYTTGTKFAINIDTTGKTLTVSSTTATPATYTKIKNLKSFSGLDGSASDIDITHLESAAKEFRAGLVDNGGFTAEVDQDTADTGQLAARTAQVAGTTKNFKVTLPNAAVASFSGYVKKFSSAGKVDDVLRSSIEIKVAGAVTWS